MCIIEGHVGSIIKGHVGGIVCLLRDRLEV